MINIDKIMDHIQEEARDRGLFKTTYNLRYSEKVFLINVRKIIEREIQK